MPTVEKVRGGRVYLRTLERRFSIGDRADVDEEEAEYLTEVRGDFDVVGEAEELPEPDNLTVDEYEVHGGGNTFEDEYIDAGECPWCDEYEGENVGMHASRAHPDKWDDYTED